MLRYMVGPIWLSWLLASLMLFSALYHGGRLVTAGQRGRGLGLGPTRGPNHGYDDDLAHLVMSTAMAAMLVISFSAHIAMAWGVVIGVPLVWFILRAGRVLTSGDSSTTSGGASAATQPMQQVPMFAAMLFMLVVGGSSASAASAAPAVSAASPVVTDGTTTAGMGMPGMTMGGQVSPDLGGSTWSVAVTALVLVGVLCLVAVRHARQLRAAVATQRISLGCQLAMSGTMIYLLALMV
jgi:Domain of unknown function (DUF5134)